MKVIKYSFVSISILLLIAIVAAIIFLRSFDINSYKPLIEKSVTDTLGREFKINGEIKMAIALSPTIVIENISLANMPSGTVKDMASLKKIELKFSLLDLLKGIVKLDNIEADSLFLMLETDRKQNPNWNFVPKTQEVNQNNSDIEKEVSDLGLDLDYAFGDILIKQAQIIYLNGTNASKTEVVLDKAYLNSAGQISIKGKVNNKNLTIEGENIDFISVLNGEKSLPISMNIVYDNNTLNIAGKIDNIQELSGINLDVSAQGNSIPLLNQYNAKAKIYGSLETLSLKNIDLVAGKPETISIKAKGNIGNIKTMAETKINMSVIAVNNFIAGIKPFSLDVNVNEVKGMSAFNTDINFKAGKTSIVGSINADISGKKPNVTANLSSPLFQIDDIFSDEAYSKNKQEITKNNKEEDTILVFSDEPLPWGKLADLNLSAKINFDKIVFPEVSRSIKTVADISLKDSILNLSMINASSQNDSLQTDLFIDASKIDTADLSLNVVGKNIVLGQIFYKLLKEKIQGGITDIDLDLETHGDSLHILMSNISGHITIVLENAKLKSELVSWVSNDVLIKIMNTLKGIIKTPKEKHNDIQCLVANLNIKNGKTTLNKGVAIETDSLFVVLDGNVDLGTERMNLSLQTSSPDALSTGVTNLITGMVKIDGSFSEPSIGVDSKGVVGAAATVGAALITGGISYLGQRLMSTTVVNDSPCVTALGKPLPSGKGKKTSNPKK